MKAASQMRGCFHVFGRLNKVFTTSQSRFNAALNSNVQGAEPKQAGKRAQSQASLELCRTRAVRRRQTFEALNRRERGRGGVREICSSLAYLYFLCTSSRRYSCSTSYLSLTSNTRVTRTTRKNGRLKLNEEALTSLLEWGLIVV